jgi:amino acid transporter
MLIAPPAITDDFSIFWATKLCVIYTLIILSFAFFKRSWLLVVVWIIGGFLLSIVSVVVLDKVFKIKKNR